MRSLVYQQVPSRWSSYSGLLYETVQQVEERLQSNCQYECGRPCDKQCTVTIRNIDVELPCGHHVDSLPCWQYQHPEQAKCSVKVERTIPGCDHTVSLPCFLDLNTPVYVCTATCGALQPCGHTCKDKCCKCRLREGQNIIKEEHGECRQQCGRNFTNCKHSCTAPCHSGEACPLCDQVCDVQCSHARCMKKCSEPCAPCAEEECASCCPHVKCNMPCAAPCDWVPCSQRCTNLLDCGHQCPSVCGAECPSKRYCQTCAPDEIKSLRADVIMLSSYAEIDLSESPCIFLPCGHVFQRRKSRRPHGHVGLLQIGCCDWYADRSHRPVKSFLIRRDQDVSRL